jgi:hypothetical protein
MIGAGQSLQIEIACKLRRRFVDDDSARHGVSNKKTSRSP